MIVTIYDPPSGWMFGFPRVYSPREGECLEDTLVRDGYPARDASWAADYTRFWQADDEGVEPSKPST